jgi:hypothetical protein
VVAAAVKDRRAATAQERAAFGPSATDRSSRFGAAASSDKLAIAGLSKPGYFRI